jgi:hypothetical protein
MKRLIILALGQLFLTLPANAAVIYSGIQNIVIPADFNGIHINLDNAATSASPFTGWDINPFFGGAGFANSAAFQPARLSSGSLDPVIRLNLGDMVGSSLIYSSGFGGSGDSVPHLGVASNQFGVGQEGYMGFLFTTDASTGPYYGWMRVAFTNNAPGGIIKDWAYDDTGSAITVQSIPEPSRALLLMLGIGTALFRRRR